jgi:hypothetical protein
LRPAQGKNVREKREGKRTIDKGVRDTEGKEKKPKDLCVQYMLQGTMGSQ